LSPAAKENRSCPIVRRDINQSFQAKPSKRENQIKGKL